MSNNINIIHLTGNVAKIEPGITQNAKQVANVTLAKNVEGKKTIFIDMVAWENAEELFETVSVGDMIYIEGKFSHDYSKDDKPKPKIKIVNFRVLLTKELRSIGYIKDRTLDAVEDVNNKLGG